MSTNKTSGTRLPLAVAAAAGLVAVTALYWASDNAMRSQFDMALANPALSAADLNRPRGSNLQPVAASEDFWLGDARRAHVTPAAWNTPKPLAVGERVSLGIKGFDSLYEVVSVKIGPADLLEATSETSSGAAKRPLLVTLQPLGRKASPVHLILEDADQLNGVVHISERPHEL